MTKMTEFTFLSTDGKTKLHAMEWRPEGDVKAVVQILHGVSEHISRYDHFARFLCDNGFAVVGHDHLGHGESVTECGVSVYFGDGNTWNTVVDDAYALHCRIKEQYPDTKLVMMGHSMGSFLCRTYLIRYPGTVDAAIVMGTGWQAGGKLNAGLALSAMMAKKDPRSASPLVNNMAFGSYNKAFKPQRTVFDWLSADVGNVDAYMADPLCGQPATVGLFHEMLWGIKFNQKFSSLDKMDGHTPVLLISGGADPVGDMGAGVRQTYTEFKRAGVGDCTLKLYPGLRHEILNEKAHRDEVYGDILTWLEAKVG